MGEQNSPGPQEHSGAPSEGQELVVDPKEIEPTEQKVQQPKKEKGSEQDSVTKENVNKVINKLKDL